MNTKGLTEDLVQRMKSMGVNKFKNETPTEKLIHTYIKLDRYPNIYSMYESLAKKENIEFTAEGMKLNNDSKSILLDILSQYCDFTNREDMTSLVRESIHSNISSITGDSTIYEYASKSPERLTGMLSNIIAVSLQQTEMNSFNVLNVMSSLFHNNEFDKDSCIKYLLNLTESYFRLSKTFNDIVAASASCNVINLLPDNNTPNIDSSIVDEINGRYAGNSVQDIMQDFVTNYKMLANKINIPSVYTYCTHMIPLASIEINNAFRYLNSGSIIDLRNVDNSIKEKWCNIILNTDYYQSIQDIYANLVFGIGEQIMTCDIDMQSLLTKAWYLTRRFSNTIFLQIAVDYIGGDIKSFFDDVPEEFVFSDANRIRDFMVYVNGFSSGVNPDLNTIAKYVRYINPRFSNGNINDGSMMIASCFLEVLKME